jgi:methenyltetrahydrofolate cyclohydrolase
VIVTERPLLDSSLAALLESVAARTPAPGGGVASAHAGAFAAALAEMAAAFAVGGRPRSGDEGGFEAARERAAALREQLLGLAQDELGAYQPVLDAMRSSDDDDGAQRQARIDEALSRAADSPLAIARACAEVAALAAELSHSGSRHLTGDAVTGALLGEAACAAAVRLAELNLAHAPADPRLREAGELAQAAAAARSRALAATDG